MYGWLRLTSSLAFMCTWSYDLTRTQMYCKSNCEYWFKTSCTISVCLCITNPNYGPTHLFCEVCCEMPLLSTELPRRQLCPPGEGEVLDWLVSQTTWTPLRIQRWGGGRCILFYIQTVIYIHNEKKNTIAVCQKRGEKLLNISFFSRESNWLILPFFLAHQINIQLWFSSERRISLVLGETY